MTTDTDAFENQYEMNGYESREDYLLSLSETYCVDSEKVKAIADLLGEDEDFDELVTILEIESMGDGL